MLKLNPLELKKPVFIEKGECVTLERLVKKPRALKLAELSRQDQRDLVIKRYEIEPKDKAIAIIRKGVFTMEQLMEEIKKDSDVGKLAITKEIKWVEFVVRKALEGQLL